MGNFRFYFLFIVLILLIGQKSEAQFAGGDGTEESPWQISTIKQLDSVRNHLDGHFILLNSLDFEGSEYDSINRDTGWVPIGESSTPFVGSFNGNGCSIGNLYINSDSNYTGLFGYTSKANINCLSITNCYVKGASYCGGLIGYSENTNTTSSYVTGSISGYYVGFLSGKAVNDTIKQCYSSGIMLGSHYGGGIVGYGDKCFLQNCYAIGKVYAVTCSGGIVGYMNGGNVNACYSVCNLRGKDFIGGLVGKEGSSIDGANNYYFIDNITHYFPSVGSEQEELLGFPLSLEEMELSSSFKGFDFDSIWVQTDHYNFPCLRSVYNFPFILPQAIVGHQDSAVVDTLQRIPMDASITNISLKSNSYDMTLEGGVFKWKCDTVGEYNFHINTYDENNVFLSSTVLTCKVFPFKGNGTEKDPFEINTIEDLDLVRNYMKSFFIQTGDLDFEGSEYDSINSDTGWVPLGDDDNYFCGSFDGNGHAINNLYIQSSKNDKTGLFSFLFQASVSNLTIGNCNIYGDYGNGGLASRSNYSKISNCSVSGYVSGYCNVGGLLYSSKRDTIKNCYVSGIVYCDQGRVGGFIGYCGTSSYIENCYSSVNCDYGYKSNYYYGGTFFGYLSSESEVKTCYYNEDCVAEGIDVIGTGDSIAMTGLSTEEMKHADKFSGFDFESIWTNIEDVTFPRLKDQINYPIVIYKEYNAKENSSYIDTVYAIPMDDENLTYTLLSGPAGMIVQDGVLNWDTDSVGEYDFKVKVTDGENRSSCMSFVINVWPFSGGAGTEGNPFQITSIEELDQVRNYMDSYFVLMNDLDFTGSDYDSENSDEGWEPIGNDSNSFEGRFNGRGHIISNLYINRSDDNVGLFGRIEGAEIKNLGIVSCAVTGNDNVGSFAGASISSNISNCYAIGNFYGDLNIGAFIGVSNRGEINDCYSDGYVNGVEYVGGFIGVTENTKISNVYDVSCVDGNDYLGSFVGCSSSSNTFNHCYYHNVNTEKLNGIGEGYGEVYVKELSILQMKNNSSWKNFDFDSIWTITENSTFPRLRSVYNCPLMLPLENQIKSDSIFVDTLSVRIIPMDNKIQSCILKEGPYNMFLEDSVLKWKVGPVDSVYAISLTDRVGYTTSINSKIEVIPFEGEGSLASPYQISSIDDLNRVRYYLDDYFILMNDLNFNGSKYDNINSSKGWESIGSEEESFKGGFNGHGHIINNLYLKTYQANYHGLFGYVSNAIIDSLGLVNYRVLGSNEIGGLVGEADSSSISYCYATGDIDGNNNVGGLIGQSIDSNISCCYVMSSIEGNENAGGLIGYAQGNEISELYTVCHVNANSNSGLILGVDYENYLDAIYYTNLIGNRIDEVGEWFYSEYGDYDVSYLSFEEMRNEKYFDGFDFDGVWDIEKYHSFPTLKGIDNVPFAVADTIKSMENILDGAYDFETGADNLIWELDSVVSNLSGVVYTDTLNLSDYDKWYVYYKVGEVRSLENDTLWGGLVNGFLDLYISNTLNENGVIVYPNPVVSNNVYLMYDDDVVCKSIWLYDLYGNLIKFFEGEQEVINLHSCDSGIYILKIQLESGTVLRRIVKE